MQKKEIIHLNQGPNLKILLPGSKSITQRAFFCAGLAEGRSKIMTPLEADDTNVMIFALKKLGVGVERLSGYSYITGVGGKLKKGKLTLNLGGSALAARLLMPLMMLREGETIFTGDPSLRKRPMKDLIESLKDLGAKIEYLNDAGFLPIRFFPSPSLQKTLVKLKMDKSSQYLSALLLTAPLFSRPLTIKMTGRKVSQPYLDMTVAVMKAFGVSVRRMGDVFKVKPQSYRPTDYCVEGDATAATYFKALHFLHGGRLEFKNLNDQRSIQGDADFSSVLKRLKVGHARTIDMTAMPDAAMTLAICALFTKGKTTIIGLSTLRHKETDRLKALETELKKIGAKVKVGKDRLEVYPLSPQNLFHRHPISIETYNDHRMAMCFGILATKIPGLIIENPNCVKKTYPDFWKDLKKFFKLLPKVGNKNILLIGMPASGKTTHGKEIAKALGRKFVDVDHEIEKAENMKIKDLVKLKGWVYFRKIEQKICSLFEYSENLVIATGGGVILDPKKMKALKKNSLTVFLFAEPQVLCERLKKDPGRPPLTDKKLETEVRQIWQERRELYLKYADVIWNTDDKLLTYRNLYL